MPVPVRVFIWKYIEELLKEYFPNLTEGEYSHSNCYDSIVLNDENLTLPSKQEFETKLLEKLNSSDKTVIKNITRHVRSDELRRSDYMFTSDYPLTDEKRQIWGDYRTKLRDWTDNVSNVYFNNNFELVNLEIPPHPDGYIIELDYEIPQRIRV
jgi:hypothetical protein